MAFYHLRLFLDAGAGVCLWSQDAAGKARFGYAVETASLGLAADVAEDVLRLIRDHDEGFNWNDPGVADDESARTAFGYEADAPFRDRVLALLPRLRAALGPDFEIESSFED
jgi:hypothetical protein